MKKLEINQIENLNGGVSLAFALGVACAVSVGVIGAATGPVGMGWGISFAIHSCGLGLFA